MKLIDILNLIAKGELEEGTKIRYSGNVFVYKDSLLLNTQNKDYFSIYGWGSLKEEVEIIGKDTKIEELRIDIFNCEALDCENEILRVKDKLNEVIRVLNGRASDGENS